MIQLLEFHTQFKRHRETIPNISIPQIVKAERKMLLSEEVRELIEAIDGDSLENISKELCDVLYAVFGTAVAFGLTDNLEAIFEEVHKSNMSKLDQNGQPLIREDGKILKSELYRKPDLSGFFST